MTNKMKKAATIFLMTTLLLNRVGYCQLFKVGVEGFQRWSSLSSTVNSAGPLQIDTHNKRYSYGLNLSYELGNNGVEVGLYSFPYRIDLRFDKFFNTQSGPSNIPLMSILYKRKLVSSKRYRFAIYALGGLDFGKYQKAEITEGIGTITLNGSTIYESHLDRHWNYDKSTVLFPTLKLEVDKNLSSHFIVSAHASYLPKNWFGYSKPLEEGNYTYTYYQKSGSGKLADFGNGILFGIALKYQVYGHSKT